MAISDGPGPLCQQTDGGPRSDHQRAKKRIMQTTQEREGGERRDAEKGGGACGGGGRTQQRMREKQLDRTNNPPNVLPNGRKKPPQRNDTGTHRQQLPPSSRPPPPSFHSAQPLRRRAGSWVAWYDCPHMQKGRPGFGVNRHNKHTHTHLNTAKYTHTQTQPNSHTRIRHSDILRRMYSRTKNSSNGLFTTFYPEITTTWLHGWAHFSAPQWCWTTLLPRCKSIHVAAHYSPNFLS